MARRHELETFPCGCWYEHVSEDGETLVLRLTTCSFCMEAAWVRIDNALADKNAQLALIPEDLEGTLPSEGNRTREVS